MANILSTTIVALIPKDGANTEAELRHIGLTPMIHRVWVSVRKRCIANWTASLSMAHAFCHLLITLGTLELAKSMPDFANNPLSFSGLLQIL